ncbi:uncharacterized protein [Branchiostoma lanceolatum]|uniref:uncharacterized protein n=1 Tax=Branchiostoma lanceolatum TaxID=7740 RepID=UPI003451C520
MDVVRYLQFGLLLCTGTVHLPTVTSLIDPRLDWHTPSEQDLRQVRWAMAAYHYMHNLVCEAVFFTTERECRTLVSIPRSSVHLYMTEPAARGTGGYLAVLPDGGLARAGRHNAVIALDPYPKASFGHLVLVFFLDTNVAASKCASQSGVYLGDRECLTLSLKNRCRNALQRNLRRRNFARRCEINFLPKVRLVNDAEKKQQLRCLDHIDGFAACPLQPDIVRYEIPRCELTENTRRCEKFRKGEGALRGFCRPWETCDRAVIVGSGWNPQVGRDQQREAAVKAWYGMLRRYGFKRSSITTFYGSDGDIDLGESPVEAYPATHKLSIRNFIVNTCRHPTCVETLVIYLNSPATNDDEMLLWDKDGDGQASKSESYKVSEFLEDIENCLARRVFVFVDQSYSGSFVDKLRASRRHTNVAVFVSSKANEYSWNTEFTMRWVNASHTECIGRIHKFSRYWISSQVDMAEGAPGVVNTTIFGAPCDVIPPYSDHELKHGYMGCQTLPTAYWLLKWFGTSST